MEKQAVVNLTPKLKSRWHANERQTIATMSRETHGGFR